VVKFEDLQAGMELRGTVLNVVDFGAFVDVGLSDSGLVHISQLSAAYVKDPHDVVAVGDQVRVWVASIDKDRRRVALTMVPPGSERPKPAEKPRSRPRRRPSVEKSAAQPQSQPQPEGAAPPQRRPAPPRERRPDTPRRDRREERRPQHSGAYEKRAARQRVPITPAMEEGKEAMRTFADLLQFHQKKVQAKDQPPAQKTEPPEQPDNSANGSAAS
jgi:uncharacterized protein